MHLGSIDIETPNDFDVAAQMLPNEQQRWRDFSSGFKILRYINLFYFYILALLISNPGKKKYQWRMGQPQFLGEQ